MSDMKKSINCNNIFLKNELSASDKTKILNYLKSFEPDSATGSKVFDEIKNKSTNIELLGYEDDSFFWDSNDIYYFENYDMKLSDEFVNSILS